jgi:hypothetical protein
VATEALTVALLTELLRRVDQHPEVATAAMAGEGPRTPGWAFFTGTAGSRYQRCSLGPDRFRPAHGAIGAGSRQGGSAMHRLTCLMVIGALAVVISAVAAGPAAAAKGGNSDNAHACQQGGHTNLFEVESGNPFTTLATAPATEPRAWRRRRWPSTFPTRPTHAPAAFAGGHWSPRASRQEPAGRSRTRSATWWWYPGKANASGSVDQILNVPCGATKFLVQVGSTTSTGAWISHTGSEAPC